MSGARSRRVRRVGIMARLRRFFGLGEWREVAKKEPVVLWCQACETGYACLGQAPPLCPEYHAEPNWTTRKPYKPSVNDAKFLRSIKICGEP